MFSSADALQIRIKPFRFGSESLRTGLKVTGYGLLINIHDNNYFKKCFKPTKGYILRVYSHPNDNREKY